MISLPNEIQADPAFVSECVGENVDAEKCKDQLDDNHNNDEEVKEDKSALTNEMSTGSLIMNFIKTVFALLVILALIYFLLKFLNKRNKLYNQVKTLENLGGISVGQNKSIQMIRLGSKIYMVGVGENVELLQEIDDEDVIHELMQSQDENNLQTGQFLASVFKPIKSKTQRSQDKTYPTFKNMFSNELNKLKQNRLKVKNQQKEKED